MLVRTPDGVTQMTNVGASGRLCDRSFSMLAVDGYIFV
jgi:hypothetical protein